MKSVVRLASLSARLRTSRRGNEAVSAKTVPETLDFLSKRKGQAVLHQVHLAGGDPQHPGHVPHGLTSDGVEVEDLVVLGLDLAFEGLQRNLRDVIAPFLVPDGFELCIMRSGLSVDDRGALRVVKRALDPCPFLGPTLFELVDDAPTGGCQQPGAEGAVFRAGLEGLEVPGNGQPSKYHFTLGVSPG